jgi:hypothetical protein
MSIKPLYLLAMSAIIGCAPAPGTPGGAPQRSVVLTADDIAPYAEGKSAYDVVSRLRPSWLRARGVRSRQSANDSSEFALVVIDGHPMGRIQLLRDIPAPQLAALRFYEPDVATGNFGTRGGSGAILVTTKASIGQ